MTDGPPDGLPDGRWALRYVGRTDCDCAELVTIVQHEVFRRAAPAPARPDHDTVRARDAHVAALAREWAVAIETGDARDGDVVVMRHLGRRVGAHHLGVYVSGGRVLHAMPELGVCLHRLEALPSRGLELTGLYRLREARQIGPSPSGP